jgi:hypothetical protein
MEYCGWRASQEAFERACSKSLSIGVFGVFMLGICLLSQDSKARHTECLFRKGIFPGGK